MKRLFTNPRFQNLLPPLSPSELAELEASIKNEGVRDPIVVWGDIIVDGHNRYRIASENGLDFQTVEKDFASEDEACMWIVLNQSARRNLTKSQLAMIAEGLATLPRGANQHADQSVCSQSQVAEKFGISIDTIQQAKKVRSGGVAELVEAVETGKISVKEGAKLSRLSGAEQKEIIGAVVTGQADSVLGAIRERKIAERREQIDAMRRQSVEMPTGKFSCIVIDPPWKYDEEYDPDYYRGASPYPEMSHEELMEMDIAADDDCVMFLWTTQRFIRDGFALLQHWGFEYKATLVWDKVSLGLGNFLRQQCEFCLIGFKGKPLLDNPNDIRDIIREQKREHSRKPEAFYELVKTLCPGSKVEYFARQQREGFTCYGNDTEKFQDHYQQEDAA